MNPDLNPPDLNQTWETFLPLRPSDDVLQVMKHLVRPVLLKLREEMSIGWYCVLVHNRDSGVPTWAGDKGNYVHVRFHPMNYQYEVVSRLFPGFIWTRHVPMDSLFQIGGLDLRQLDTGYALQAWRLIGAQSEWFMDFLGAHAIMDRWQYLQFLHYFENMGGVRFPCRHATPWWKRLLRK